MTKIEAKKITKELREFITDFSVPTEEADEPRTVKKINFLPDSALELIGDENNLNQVSMMLTLPGDNKMLFSAGLGLIDKLLKVCFSETPNLKKILDCISKNKDLVVKDKKKRGLISNLNYQKVVVVIKSNEDWESEDEDQKSILG